MSRFLAKRPTRGQEQAFKMLFKQQLMPFVHPLFGFDIVHFERALGFDRWSKGEDDNKSLEEHILEDYGKDAVELVWDLLGGRPKKQEKGEDDE